MQKRKLSRQAVFTKAWKSIIKQGKPSMNGSVCAYRSEDGSKCAVGHLIPDELYTKAIEGNSIFRVLQMNGSVIKKIKKIQNIFDLKEISVEFLQEIQIAHDSEASDNLSFITNFKSKMMDIAKNYKLNVPKTPQ